MLKRDTFLSYQLQICDLSKVSANWVPDYKTLLPSEDDK
jgi:hypothetical protein